jgi:hypothetical protein
MSHWLQVLPDSSRKRLPVQVECLHSPMKLAPVGANSLSGGYACASLLSSSQRLIFQIAAASESPWRAVSQQIERFAWLYQPRSASQYSNWCQGTSTHPAQRATIIATCCKWLTACGPVRRWDWWVKFRIPLPWGFTRIVRNTVMEVSTKMSLRLSKTSPERLLSGSSPCYTSRGMLYLLFCSEKWCITRFLSLPLDRIKKKKANCRLQTCTKRVQSRIIMLEGYFADLLHASPLWTQ